MKNITDMPARSTLPKELLNLPQPWGMTHSSERRQEIRSLSYNKRSIKTALNVLERSLHSLSQLTLSETDSIPEDMITYWGFTAEWLAYEIPTLDDFNLVKVEQFLINEQQIDSPSPALIFDVAEYWVWWVTKSIQRASLYWLQRALMKTRDQELISRFLRIAKRYWQKIEPRFAESLLSRSAMIGWQKALPLLESVEQNPLAPEEIKETVREYRQLVLKSPEKWLPDEAKEEMPAKQAPQRVEASRQPVLQPALGQLSYAWGHSN